MKLNNLKIGQRLALGFGMILALLVLVTATGLSNMNTLNNTVDNIVNGNNLRLQAANDMREAQRSVTIAVRDIILTEDEAETRRLYEEIGAGWQAYDRADAVLQKMVTRPDMRALLGKITDARTTSAPLIAQAAELGKLNKQAEGFEVLKSKVKPATAAWRNAIAEMIRAQTELNAADQAAGAAQYGKARVVLYAVAAAAILLAVVIAWRITRSITGPMREAVRIATTVAAGDLTSRIEVDSKDETGELLAALKAMNESLRSIVHQVRDGTRTLATATDEIATGNLDLSSRTEQQASALEETASSMEELTSTVKQNAENARQANQLVQSASDVAVRGGSVVAAVVTTMGSINESASRIVDIIGVIDGIAFQTNILALNAAVEAARAGEQGRGFAVVASEVRNLAQRSASAAKEIKTLIDDSVGKVNEGSRLVHEAGSTMEDVVDSVRRVTDIMAEITAASQEQEAGIEQINQAVSEMDAVTQQNAALVEEAAAAAQSLQDQSGELEQMVSTFRLPDAAVAAAPAFTPRRPAAAVRPVTRPALAAAGNWETF
ncbi:methyl-accepting chemotaxis protein [Massilia sp. Root335]|uniref:methyl-accepting chemotaxis protein n=1 Tax=Massilia sp. Root335 TaxID=1736517 RepID=UPI0006F20152|nr:methyl-accepting chemotaxis protein [Massilia sp. Root335]KQV50874.1 chemotaxis protein [Massilia sp. Root335]